MNNLEQEQMLEREILDSLKDLRKCDFCKCSCNKDELSRVMIDENDRVEICEECKEGLIKCND